MWLSSFSQMSERNIPFHSFFSNLKCIILVQISVIVEQIWIKLSKKVSPVEQRLIDQLRRVCILVKGFTRDAWMRLKLIRETWILMKGERDSWIYEPKWDVICLLIYTWPINFFFHFVKTSRFPRNIRTET